MPAVSTIAKTAPPPLDLPVNPVPRRPRFVGNHRHPRAHQTIEQRGLPYVRSTHNGDQRRARRPPTRDRDLNRQDCLRQPYGPR